MATKRANTAKTGRGGKKTTMKQRAEVEFEPRLTSIKRPRTARTAVIEGGKAKKLPKQSATEPIDVDASGPEGSNDSATDADEPEEVDVTAQTKGKGKSAMPRKPPARQPPIAAALASKAPAKSKTIANRAGTKHRAPSSSDDDSSDSSEVEGGRLTVAKLKHMVDRHARWCPFVKMNKKIKVCMSMARRAEDQLAERGVDDGSDDDDEDGARNMIVENGTLKRGPGPARGGRGGGGGADRLAARTTAKGGLKADAAVAAERKAKTATKATVAKAKPSSLTVKSLSPGTLGADRDALHLDSTDSASKDDDDVTEPKASPARINDGDDETGEAEEEEEDDAEEDGEEEDEHEVTSASRKEKDPASRNLTPVFQAIHDRSSLTEPGSTPELASADAL